MSITIVKKFELDDYLGTWYEIARLPIKYQPKDSTDVSAHYAFKADYKTKRRF